MRSRPGFTLVELLVVVLIIGMLVALLLPAVNAARERGRQAQCMNNLRELATAANEFETSKEVFPAYVDTIVDRKGTADTSDDVKSPTSFVVRLLPNLGRQDLWEEWRVGNFAEGKNIRLASLTCPSDFPTSDTTDAPLSYVMNSGLADVTDENASLPIDWAANGIGHCRFDTKLGTTHPAVKVSQEDIRDGSQFTILFSENIQAGRWDYTSPTATLVQLEGSFGMVWWLEDKDSSTTDDPQAILTAHPGAKINQFRDQPDWPLGYSNYLDLARPSSNHPDMVHVAYCDGHVASMNDAIDYVVYGLLMTPDGKNAKVANENISAGPPWTTTKISEADLK